MQNWRDYVDLQQALEGQNPNIVHGWRFVIGDPNTFNLSKFDVDAAFIALSDEEVGVEVENLLHTFPVVDCPDGPLHLSYVAIQKNNVAQTTRRGVPATNFEDVWYYKGSGVYDSPIIVLERMEKFYVFKIPDFDKFGFKVNKIEEKC